MPIERDAYRVKPTEEARTRSLNQFKEFMSDKPPTSEAPFFAVTDQIKSLELALNFGDSISQGNVADIRRCADAYEQMSTVIRAGMRQASYNGPHVVSLGIMRAVFGSQDVFECAQTSSNPEIRRDLRTLVADLKGSLAELHGQEAIDSAFNWYKQDVAL